MNYSIFDMETDGLIETVTKIHCVSVHKFHEGKDYKFNLTDYDQIKKFFSEEECLVGHNIIRYDIPVLNKFGITTKARLIDSLGLSWYLYPDRIKHGLEFWGNDLGVQKPKIADWSNLNVGDYIHRCEQDVEINRLLFNLQGSYLFQLYEGDRTKIDRFIGYLMFKLDCAREQEQVKWKLDVDKCKEGLEFFHQELKIKIDILTKAMPKVIKFKDVVRPKAMYLKPKITKTIQNPIPVLSVAGDKWVELLKERGLPDYHLGTIQVKISEEDGNPGSHAQLKKWLFNIGWIPQTFKYVKEDDGTLRKVPQLSKDGEPDICDSVKLLFDKEPSLKSLQGLFILKHRIGILDGFIENKDDNNFLKAEIHGFTNTLRFQHSKPIVNLPTIPKPYWERVRGCLIAPDDDHVLCGSDMAQLEDNTKRHYMYYYDPEYVKEMMTPGFDSHLDIAVLAGMLTKEQAEDHKIYDKSKGKEGKSSKAVRLKAKKVNFAGVYGAGPPKIALTAGIPLSEAKLLHVTYWKRNWSVKKIGENCIIKTIGTQAWLHNPVSQFWYTLRVVKDAFSTLNQGTGVYCFDSWIRNVRKQDIKICGQFHDEHIAPVLKGQEEEHSLKLRNAITWTNDELKLNVPLGISIDFGHSYADIH